MFRFTIRDVLWVTVVLGLGMAWALERRENARLRREIERGNRTPIPSSLR
jgi:hypothetical protein